MVHPCCHFVSLQIATKVIAIIDAIGAMFGAVTSLVVLFGIAFFRKELEDEFYTEETEDKNYELKIFLKQPDGVQYTMLGFTLMISILEIVVAVALFKGARTRSATQCTIWFRIHCVLLFLAILFSILTVIIAEEQIILAISCLIGILYQAYSLWIVKAFIHQLNSIKFTNDEDEDEQGQPLQEIQKTE